MSEKDLIAGVLGRAFQDAAGDIHDVLVKDRASIQRQGRRWISADSSRSFSFLWVCQILDLDPAAIRARLKAGRISFREEGEGTDGINQFKKK